MIPGPLRGPKPDAPPRQSVFSGFLSDMKSLVDGGPSPKGKQPARQRGGSRASATTTTTTTTTTSSSSSSSATTAAATRSGTAPPAVPASAAASSSATTTTTTATTTAAAAEAAAASSSGRLGTSSSAASSAASGPPTPPSLSLSGLFSASSRGSRTPPPPSSARRNNTPPPDMALPDGLASGAGGGGGGGGCGVSYVVTLHELCLTREIAEKNTTVFLECAGTRYHIPVQACFRKAKPDAAAAAAAAAAAQAADMDGADAAGASSEVGVGGGVGAGGGQRSLRMRFVPPTPFVDLHIYAATEGILSVEVSGQITVPLSPLFCEDHHTTAQIVQQPYAFWYFRGKHLPTYPAGIPEVPSSALRIPKAVGFAVLSIAITKPRTVAGRYAIYLSPQLKTAPQKEPTTSLSTVGIEEIEEKIFRLLRAYERFILRVQTAPWWLESFLLPLLLFRSPPRTGAAMTLVAVSALTTPLYLIPFDFFLAIFCVSIVSKNAKSISCICWEDDPRLKEPDDAPHTIVGKLVYAKKVLDEFIYRVELLLYLFELAPTSLDFTDPVVTLTLFAAATVGTAIVCAALHAILFLQAWSPHPRLLWLLFLWAPFAAGAVVRDRRATAAKAKRASKQPQQTASLPATPLTRTRRAARFAESSASAAVLQARRILAALQEVSLKLPSVPEQEHRHIAGQQRLKKVAAAAPETSHVHENYKRTDDRLVTVPLPVLSKGGRSGGTPLQQPSSSPPRTPRSGAQDDPHAIGSSSSSSSLANPNTAALGNMMWGPLMGLRRARGKSVKEKDG